MPKKALPTQSRFGEALRAAREKLQISKADVAASLGLSASFIDVLETGRRGCNLDDIPRIAAVLQVDSRILAMIYLAERHARFYRALFDELPGEVEPISSIAVEDTHWRLEQLPRRERGIVEALVYSLFDLSTRSSLTSKWEKT